MAGLNFAFRVVKITDYFLEGFPVPQTIDELKNLLGNALEDGNFQDVVNTPTEVALNLRDVRISIIHLPFNGPEVHQVIMGGGTGDTQAEVKLIANFVRPSERFPPI